MPGHEPRQFFSIGHRGIRNEAHARHPDGTGDFHTRFDGEILSQRDDIDRRIVCGAVEYELAAIDLEALSENEIGSVDGADGAARGDRVVGAARDTQGSREPGVESLADESQVVSQRHVEIEQQRDFERASRVRSRARPAGDHDILAQCANARRFVVDPALLDLHAAAYREFVAFGRHDTIAADRQMEIGAVDGAEFLRRPRDASRSQGSARTSVARRARQRPLRGESAVAALERKFLERQRVVGDARAQSPIVPVRAVLRNVDADRVRRERACENDVRETAARRKIDVGAAIDHSQRAEPGLQRPQRWKIRNQRSGERRVARDAALNRLRHGVDVELGVGIACAK